MKTFFNILQTIGNIKNKKYPDEPFELITNNLRNNFTNNNDINNDINDDTNKTKSYIHFMINLMYQKTINICSEFGSNNTHFFYKAKFNTLNYFLVNTFIQKELKEQIVNTFSSAQKYYYAFSKLAHNFRQKKYNLVVSSDLMLNPLEITHVNTFVLIQNKTKYLFGLHDLISIIENAIGNTDHFFSDPLWPRNPYNNQEFHLVTLYNIYFKMKQSPRIMSTLFHLFFLESFSTSSFSENHEAFIRDYAIKKYVFNSPPNEITSSILTMLKSNFFTRKLHIDIDFPKDILASIFRPFLYYYYIVHYDISGTSKVENYNIILQDKLKIFYKFNPIFGRKIVKLIKSTKSPNKVIKQEYEFITKHIRFYDIDIQKQPTYTNAQFVNNINDTEDDDANEDDYDANEDDDDDEDQSSETIVNNNYVDYEYMDTDTDTNTIESINNDADTEDNNEDSEEDNNEQVNNYVNDTTVDVEEEVEVEEEEEEEEEEDEEKENESIS
jgi:hypothetical protein